MNLRFLLATLLFVTLAGALAPVTSADEGQPSAQQFYDQGMQHFASGEYEPAKQAFRQVDSAQLSADDRMTMWKTIQEIDRRLHPQMTASQLLEEADEAFAAKRWGDARESYDQVSKQKDATGKQKTLALTRLGDIRRITRPNKARMRALIGKAKKDIEAGRFDEAEAKLNKIKASGVDLGWYDHDVIKKQLKTIAEQKQQVAQVSDPTDASPGAPAQSALTGGDDTGGTAPPLSPRNRLLESFKLRAQLRVHEAKQAEGHGEYELARDRYVKALGFDPGNEDARAGAERTTQLAAQRAAPTSALEHQNRIRKLQVQKAKAQFESLMKDARDLQQQQKFTQALNSVQQAKIVLDRREELLARADYNALRGRAEALDIEIGEQQRNKEGQRKTDIERAQQQEQQKALAVEHERIQRDVQDKLHKARNFQMERKYEDALAMVRQAQFLDPNNPAIPLLQDMIEYDHAIDQSQQIRNQRSRNIVKHSIDNAEATIPPTEIMLYPSEWPEITRRRLGGALRTEDSDINRATELKMRKAIPIDFGNSEFESTIQYLRGNTGADIVVNWQALSEEGNIERDAPVTMTLRSVPADRALKLILKQVSTFDAQIDYNIEGGIVHISTKDDLSATTLTRVYDIRDVLVQVPNFTNAPEFDLAKTLSRTSGEGGGGGGGGGGELFGSEDTEEGEQPSRSETVINILDLIRTNVGDFDEWYGNGGTVSSLTELNGNLIVKTTPENHVAMFKLLSQLRETSAIQVSVETRFLLIDQNYFEEIGADIDLFVDPVGGNFGPITVNQDTFGITAAPSTGLPGSFLAAGFGGEGGIGGDGGPIVPLPSTGRSLNFSMSYIDDIQVSLLVRATQAQRRSISLTAPRLTLMNGQSAFIFIANQIAFISDVEPISEGVGFDPTLDVVQSGIGLSVEATVSADRRYVTMTVEPNISTVAQPIRRIPQTLIVEAPDTGTDDGDGENNEMLVSAFIEAPETQTAQLRTTVHVPDRGTLVMGGQRIVGEIEVESGVPILRDIPILSRLFTNRSTSKDERTLLILIKPTIIIPTEAEERLWPGLIDNPMEYDVGKRSSY